MNADLDPPDLGLGDILNISELKLDINFSMVDMVTNAATIIKAVIYLIQVENTKNSFVQALGKRLNLLEQSVLQLQKNKNSAVSKVAIANLI